MNQGKGIVCPFACEVCPVLKKRSTFEQTPLFVRQGDGKLGGHDSDYDSCKRADGTQNILGPPAVVGATLRRIRRLGTAAGATGGGGGTGARSSCGSRVGRSKGLDFEGLRSGVNLEYKSSEIPSPAMSLPQWVMRRESTDVSAVEDVSKHNGVASGSGEVCYRCRRNEFAAYIVRDSGYEREGSSQHGRTRVRNAEGGTCCQCIRWLMESEKGQMEVGKLTQR